MHEFPLVLKHRSDPHQSIVVANADQLNSVPDEFAPDEVRKARVEGGADVGYQPVENQISADGQAQRREDLDKREAAFNKAVDDWTDQVRSESQKAQEERASIERDRADIEQQRKGLDEQRQQLERDRAEFEQQKNDPARGALKQGEVTVDGGTTEQTVPEDDSNTQNTSSKRSKSKE